MTNTLHAHVSTRSQDCDGTYVASHVITLSDAEREESEQAENDFSDLHFMQRVMGRIASPYAVQFGMTVQVDEQGFRVFETTEEGYHESVVRWCREENCDRTTTARDLRAEAAGY